MVKGAFCGLVLLVLLARGAPAQTNNAPANATPERVETVQIDLGNGFLRHEFYDLALAEYQKYLDWFPQGRSVEEALYRIADCQRGLGQPTEARQQYEVVLRQFPKGDFSARAHFRIGEMDWNAGRLAESLKHFNVAAENAESPETRLTARFYEARTLIQLKKNRDAIPLLRELARAEKENPYRPFALLELAHQAEADGQDEEAQVLYSRAFATEASPVLRGEAGLQAGTLALKARRWATAADFFGKVKKLDVSDEWIAFANRGLARAYYQNDRYEEVVILLTDTKNRFPKEARAELDLLHAHALRLLRKYPEAVERYEIFLKDHPKDGSVERAAYERLLCLYHMNFKTWDAEAEAFLKVHPRAEGAAQIRYLLADRAFRRADHAAAAAWYAAIPLRGDRAIDPSRVPEITYRRGVCLAATGRSADAAGVFGEFIRQFPNHPFEANAFFQKGMAEQEAGKTDAALTSFRELAKLFPKAPERETALYRVALLLGQLKQYDGMRETFEQLLRAYPGSAWIDDATWWIGWSFFEEGNYAGATPWLERARKAKPAAYAVQATSRIILAEYRQGHRLALLKEVDALPADSPLLAPEIHNWLAQESVKAQDHPAAERQFRKLVAHPDGAPGRQAARWGLAKSLAAQAKWTAAIEVWEAYEKDYSKPAEIIATRLELVRGYMALKEFARARELAEEVLRLQPEGRNNAEARLLLGEMLAEQKQFAEAGRYYLSVAVLYDDPETTPFSFARAIQSFEAAGATNQVMKLKQELKAKYPNYQLR